MSDPTTSPCDDASQAVVRAIRDAGPRPDIHDAVMQRHRREWPTLWQALDRLVKAADDASARSHRVRAARGLQAASRRGTHRDLRRLAMTDQPTAAHSRRRDNPPNGDATLCDDGEPHRWQPVSFVFESQLLDHEGRVIVRQPEVDAGRVYAVCMTCRQHTYITTEWVGYTLGGPGD